MCSLRRPLPFSIAVSVRGGRRGRTSTSRRGGRGRGRGRARVHLAASLSEFAVEDLAAPEGWTPPPITPTSRSPIVLRRHRGCSRVAGPGLPLQPPQPSSPLRCSPSPPPLPRPLCRFSLEDFYPGATFSPTKVMSRQSIGEFCSWLHNCGEPWCPFGESTSALREQLRNQGLAYEPAIGRTLSEVPVDNRAFPEPVYVQVKLDLLGYDPNNWGGLEYFSGEITHRFYHAVTGHPCFEVDFGGCIGVREVLVANTRVHAQRQYGHHLADIPGTPLLLRMVVTCWVMQRVLRSIVFTLRCAKLRTRISNGDHPTATSTVLATQVHPLIWIVFVRMHC